MTQPMASPTVSPGAVEALYATGHWLYSQDRIAHAVTVFRAMIHIAPEDERGWLALGACHEAHDQQDIALELYATASAVARAAPRCDVARARILRARGMTEEAREALEEASRIADETRDSDLRLLVAGERGRP
jgi:tetratricopeptide (TPR) repeat protein